MGSIGSGSEASTVLDPNSCYKRPCYNEVAVVYHGPLSHEFGCNVI